MPVFWALAWTASTTRRELSSDSTVSSDFWKNVRRTAENSRSFKSERPAARISPAITIFWRRSRPKRRASICVSPYYRAADFCMVTSLHDGMNLVAKEFVAARDDEEGALILSQFTGAAREL